MLQNLRTVVWVLLAVSVSAGCTDRESAHTSRPFPSPSQSHVNLPSAEETEVRFGEARIAVGMGKQEVLEQIQRSRAQYDPLRDENSPECYVGQPSDEMVRSDVWTLTCPTRNSHVLGGGSGFMLKVEFREGKVAKLERSPWLAG